MNETPFDFLNSVLSNKIDLMKNGRTDYNPWMVNRGVSMHVDTIFYAMLINMYPQLPNLLQYKYLLNIIKARKRYSGKWPVSKKSDELKVVQRAYGMNRKNALEALKILNDEELRQLVNEFPPEKPSKSSSPQSGYVQDHNGDSVSDWDDIEE